MGSGVFLPTQPSGVWTNLISASLPLFQDEKLGQLGQLPTTILLHFPYQYVGNCMHISWLAYMQWSYLFPSSQVQLQKSMGRKKAEGRVRKGNLFFFFSFTAPSLRASPFSACIFSNPWLTAASHIPTSPDPTCLKEKADSLTIQMCMVAHVTINYTWHSKAYLLAIPWQAISLLVAGYSLTGFPIVHTTCADGPHKWWSRQ